MQGIWIAKGRGRQLKKEEKNEQRNKNKMKSLKRKVHGADGEQRWSGRGQIKSELETMEITETTTQIII